MTSGRKVTSTLVNATVLPMPAKPPSKVGSGVAAKEAAGLIDGLSAEARLLYIPRVLMRWIDEERSRSRD